MVGDWIKVRVDLPNDPKVLAIADHLAASETFWKWCGCERDMLRDISVTTSVTVSVTVTALLRIWGLVRQQGHAVERDILVEHMTLERLSRLSGIPEFGQAMEMVGWVQVTGAATLTFPNALDNMSSPEERKRQQAAERKRRQRERDKERDEKRDGHANVTPRGEKRRVDNNTPNGAASRRANFWDTATRVLVECGTPEKQARSFIGGLIKEHGEESVAEAIASLSLKPVADPKAYLKGILKPRPKMVLA